LYQFFAYIKYWLHSTNEHSLHSPFLYEFYTNIVKNKNESGRSEIEELRTTLLKNKLTVEIDDLGAGSRIHNSNRRKISQIAKHSTTPYKFSELLFRLIEKLAPETIIELGTSLGINTLYMSQARPTSKVYTFEGSETIASLAQENFTLLKIQNVELIKGNIDVTLPVFLSSKKTIDLAYIDANHRYEPTINYFNQICTRTNEKSIVIIDDIHWSKEMKQAWNEIKRSPKVSTSIDLFEAGILFFNLDLPKTELVLKY